ncbi:putative K+ channel tetramerization subfamily protein [Paratrimastix pyriformis]|uniref:K+ channel tetramerization subfamily protein n=1 Tax=Paratrimastix pyriformis TaxID=342808 RepID=A0ABQ8UI80_9EUKA|nr:putative K+ channel tetramerization subfamily protein [Paratrimastix pyriformis]
MSQSVTATSEPPPTPTPLDPPTRDPLVEFRETMEAMLTTVSGSQERLLSKKKEIDKDIQERQEAIQTEVARFLALQRECEKRFVQPEDTITINVGGRMFTTYTRNLLAQKGSTLEAMFSGRHPLSRGPDGVAIIDRNPEIFEKILDFLRTGHLPRWWAHPEQRQEFLEEMDYFGLTLPMETVIMTPDECRTLVEFIGAKSLALLYRGTRDGFAASTFHRLCDGRHHTVTVVRATSNHVFGGYAAVTWNQASKKYYDDRQAFLFSLRGTPRSPVKIPNNLSSIAGIYCHPSYGPTWGGKFDLHVGSECNAGPNSSTNLGYSYTSPEGQFFLTGGNNNFQVEELEVFACTMSIRGTTAHSRRGQCGDARNAEFHLISHLCDSAPARGLHHPEPETFFFQTISSVRGISPSPDPRPELNEDQRMAVYAPCESGHACCVYAGPGSGKTQTIASRIVHLLETGVSPSSILALTFSRKATREMQDRVRALCPQHPVTACTFHSFCVRLLRRFSALAHLPSHFAIADSSAQEAILGGILKTHHGSAVPGGIATSQGSNSSQPGPDALPPRGSLGEAHRMISKWKCLGLSPEAVERTFSATSRLAPTPEEQLALSSCRLFRLYQQLAISQMVRLFRLYQGAASHLQMARLFRLYQVGRICVVAVLFGVCVDNTRGAASHLQMVRLFRLPGR